MVSLKFVSLNTYQKPTYNLVHLLQLPLGHFLSFMAISFCMSVSQTITIICHVCLSCLIIISWPCTVQVQFLPTVLMSWEETSITISITVVCLPQKQKVFSLCTVTFSLNKLEKALQLLTLSYKLGKTYLNLWVSQQKNS